MADSKKVPSGAGPGVPRAHGPDYFEARWAEFIHRVKVHELLRVMEEEQQKLKVLQEQSDLNDLLLGAHEEDELTEEQRQKMLYIKSLEEETEEAQELANNIRANATDPDFVSKTALRLFKTRVMISDEQFNLILSLCRDKIEQKQLKDAFEEKKFREKYLHNANEQRRMLYEFLNSTFFNRMMLFFIASSTLLIVLQTVETLEIRYSFPIQLIDSAIIAVFIIEAGCKISVYKEDYFRSLWNLLDLIIISTYFLDVFTDLITKLLAMNSDINDSVIFKLFKSLRSLRLLRAVRFLPNLQVIVGTIFQSLLSLGSIGVLMALFIFLFAIIGRGFFNEEDPIHFQNLWRAMLTLFQLLTLDDWFDILDAADSYALMFFYLFCYIVLEYFVFLNLFVAVLVDNFQIALEEANIGFVVQTLNFSDPKSLGLDTNEDDEEFDQLVVEIEGATNSKVNLERKPSGNQAKDHKHGMDLNSEDYFPLEKNSIENKLMGENMKLLTSLDFEHFIWVRRMKLMALVLDRATQTKQNVWNVHEKTGDYGLEDDRHTKMTESYEPKKKEDIE